VPWDTLNLGGTVGDARDNVIENRRRLFSSIERPVESIFDVWQIHGVHIITADSPRALDKPHQRADAILSNSPQLTILMRFADCTPILLFDPVRRVMGIVHAGWQGTVKMICALAVKKMNQNFECNPEDILAGIGPSICLEHYKVGEEVCSKAREAFGDDADKVIVNINGSTHFDLRKANRIALEEAGVRKIEDSGECTACNLEKWYSHRAEKGKTGRFGAIMYLK